MDKDKLLDLSIIVAFVGIITLFLINITTELNPTTIESIDELMIGKTVKIEGEITKIRNMGNITIIEINNNSLSLIIYSKINISKNTHISATGKVSEYEDKLQIIVDKLEKR